jgi:hypothetical protein
MRCAIEAGVVAGRAIRRESDSTGARFGGVASADLLDGRGWNDFGNAGRAG